MTEPHDHSRDPQPDHPEPGPQARRGMAIQALLIEKGHLTADKVREAVERLDMQNTPARGQQVVARAWTDPDFKARLLENAKIAIADLDIDVEAPNLVAVENTDKIHNVVVCTLCSCYPTALLGLSPAWYKSLEYRSRAVSEPRNVLKEFGLKLDPDVQIRVYDSTANMRYLVVSQRPSGTGDLTEEELADLVTRDSMIGVARARSPEPTTV
ncbi:MAG: nitrile hydratase subunit alpha [bacterium]|nr:nitrile hydratase subunit alpha [bacterium]